jgi:putative phage-type endonuclease
MVHKRLPEDFHGRLSSGAFQRDTTLRSPRLSASRKSDHASIIRRRSAGCRDATTEAACSSCDSWRSPARISPIQKFDHTIRSARLRLDILGFLGSMESAVEQRSAEWYKARCGRITGSRFARAMAVRSSVAYRGLLDELVQERVSGRCMDGGRINAAMQWGIDHEDHARRWYEREHGRRVQQVGFVVHSRYDFVGVSPDGLVANDGLIEIKCPQLKNFSRVMEARHVPPQYRWQVQGQLWVCGRVWLDFVCFYPPGRGVALRVISDEDDGDRLEERCQEIHSEVQKRVRARGPRRSQSEAARFGARAEAASSIVQAKQDTDRQPSQPPSEWPWWAWVLALGFGLWLLSAIF